MTGGAPHRSLAHNAGFRWLWGGQAISLLGSQVTALALPTVAILLFDASAAQVGLLSALQYLGFPVFGLISGVTVDRYPRRPIMLGCDLARAAVLFFIPLAGWFHHLSLAYLYVAALLSGICTVFFDVAYQAYLPSLVERRELVEGNTKLSLSNSAAQVAGPPLAGGLIAVVGGPLAIGWDAASFLVSAFALSRIRDRETTLERPRSLTAVLGEIREGIVVVLGNPMLRNITLCTATTNFGGSIATAAYLLFAYRVLHFSPATVGFIGGLGSLGFIVGTALAPRLSERYGTGRALILAALAGAIAWLCTPLALYGAPFVVLLATGFVRSAQIPVYNINQVSLRQAAVAHELQGRMNATVRTIVWGTIPLGSLVGGMMAELLSLGTTLAVGGAISLAAVGWLLSGSVRMIGRGAA